MAWNQLPESRIRPSQDLEPAQSKQWQKLWGGSATEEVDYTITKVAYLIFRSIHSLQNCKKNSVGSYENLWNVSILSSASVCYYLVLVNVSTHSIITVPAPLTRVPADPQHDPFCTFLYLFAANGSIRSSTKLEQVRHCKDLKEAGFPWIGAISHATPAKLLLYFQN